MVPHMRPYFAIPALLCACTGQIDNPPPNDEPAELASLCPTTTLSVAKAPLRHLTRDQYDNTVRDLLGDTTTPARSFPPDERLGHFVAGLAVSPLLADKYIETAAALAARAMPHLDQLLGCNRDDACAHRFIETFGLKTYRRPLERTEVDALATFYDEAKAAHGFDTAMRMLLERLLSSPFFVYRVESGGPGPPRPRGIRPPARCSAHHERESRQSPSAAAARRSDRGRTLFRSTRG